jgi:VWFA-related protein
MRARYAAMLAVAVSASMLAAAQSQAVFRTETNYVEVDVVASDANGQFVTGLTVADFIVKEQNTPQRVSTFSYVELPTVRRPTSTVPPPVRFRPDMPNELRVPAERIYLFYLNSVETQYVLHMRERVRAFINQFFMPGDIGAVWNAEASGQNLTFTNDKWVLLKAVDPFFGSPPSTTTSFAARSANAALRLRDAIDYLSGIQGRRKSLILFSAGWPTMSEKDQADRSRETTEWLDGRRQGPPSTAGGFLNPSDITQRADVHIYAYDVRGLVAPDAAALTPRSSDPIVAAQQISDNLRAISASTDVLRMLAYETGGLAIVQRNDSLDNQGFARIVEDNSRYYLLGYLSSRPKRDGTFRKIDVKSLRPGVTVRARRGYVAR